MRMTLRVLSALLRYPDAQTQAAAAEFEAALVQEGVLVPDQRAALAPLLARLREDDLLDLQADYVALFDRSRTLSLHLFEHVHGEGRDRGQAMVDLRDRYLAEGLEMATHELPDYLPLFAEYLSVLPAERARAELAQPGVILGVLARRLEARSAAWAPPLRVLADLAGVTAASTPQVDESTHPADDEPVSLADLDQLWDDAPVRFDPSAIPPAGARTPRAVSILARLTPEPVEATRHG